MSNALFIGLLFRKDTVAPNVSPVIIGRDLDQRLKEFGEGKKLLMSL
jgi:hypothetical protein